MKILKELAKIFTLLPLIPLLLTIACTGSKIDSWHNELRKRAIERGEIKDDRFIIKNYINGIHL